MKTGPDALDTAENESAQKMKTGHDALIIDENESGSGKLKKGTQHLQYRPKRVRECKTLKRDLTPSVPSKTSLGAQNMKTGLDALGNVENESWRAKHENGTRCPRYRRKCVRARKTRKRDPTPSASPKTSPGG
jgi:hypothetical protein